MCIIQKVNITTNSSLNIEKLYQNSLYSLNSRINQYAGVTENVKEM